MINLMKSLIEQKVPGYEKRLLEHLSTEEQTMYETLQKYSFEENSWYRPLHNFVVTTAMIAICKQENLNRRILVPAAMFHDIGYAFIKLNGLYITTDNRKAHCEIGSQKTENILLTLKSKKKISRSDSEIKTIKLSVVFTHSQNSQSYSA